MRSYAYMMLSLAYWPIFYYCWKSLLYSSFYTSRSITHDQLHNVSLILASLTVILMSASFTILTLVRTQKDHW